MRNTCVAIFLILGACSSDGGNNGGIAIAGNPAPVAPAAGGGGIAPPRAGTGPTGLAGATGVAGTGAAGAPTGGVAGQPSAGVPAAGAGPVGVSGAGASGGAAGMVASMAGASAAGGGGGGAAGTGTTGGAGAPAPSGNTPGTVSVTFMTVTYGGEYAPGNYGAVWFEAPNAKFVKTAKRWAGTAHASDLATWTKASGGWGSIFGGGNMADMMDAMSSATLRSHQMHTVTWNMKGADGQLVPDGPYVAKLEVTESRARDRAGPVVSIQFMKSTMPQTVEVPNQEGFSGVVLRYMP